MTLFIRCLAPLLLFVASGAALADDKPAPTEAQVKEQITRIDTKQPDDVRLDAMKWLQQYHKFEIIQIAVPALEEAIRKDPISGVRDRAVLVRFRIAQERKEPCPLVVAEAALDSDEYVRQTALMLAGQAEAFATGCVDVYLKCAESDIREVRSASLLCLAIAGGKDKKVLAALEKAKRDRVFGIRHNAYCAMFRANDNLAEFLRYLLQLQEDTDAAVGPYDKNSPEGKQTESFSQLARLGSAIKILEWSEQRPADVAAALYQFANDPSPPVRRGAVRIIGASALKEDRNKGIGDDAKNQANALPPDVRPTKAAFELKKLKAGDRLRELRDKDPDEGVRRAATLALERFAEVENPASAK